MQYLECHRHSMETFKIAILCLMISGLTDMYDGTIAKMIKEKRRRQEVWNRD